MRLNSGCIVPCSLPQICDFHQPSHRRTTIDGSILLFRSNFLIIASLNRKKDSVYIVATLKHPPAREGSSATVISLSTRQVGPGRNQLLQAASSVTITTHVRRHHL